MKILNLQRRMLNSALMLNMDDYLVSRSQEKRILLRLEKFTEVMFDLRILKILVLHLLMNSFVYLELPIQNLKN